MSADLVQDRLRSPDEDPRVPGERAGRQKPFGRGFIGLFAKLDDAMDRNAVARFQERSPFDITVPRLGPRRLDAEGNQDAGVVIDHRDRGLHGGQKGRGGLDDVVGGHDDHRAERVPRHDDTGGQTHAWAGVARGGFGDYVGRGHVGKLRPSRLGLVGSGHDQYPFPRDQRLDARHRLLKHRRLAGQTEQLLGPIAPAFGPETGATATGHDDRV